MQIQDPFGLGSYLLKIWLNKQILILPGNTNVLNIFLKTFPSLYSVLLIVFATLQPPSFGMSLFFPYAPGDPQSKFLPISTGEEQSHVSRNYKPIVTVTNFSVAVADAPWNSLPDYLPPVRTHFQSVAKLFRLKILTHKSKESNVYWGYSELERLKMQAELSSETIENLHR